MRRICVAVAVVAATSSLAFGQAVRSNMRRTGRARDAEAQRQVLATDDRRREALLQGDPAPLRQIYADDYQLVTPAGVVHTKSDQINDLTSGKLRYEKIEVMERSARVYGDVVVLVSREQTDITREGQQVGGEIRVTRVYKKYGPEWRVIATHASAIGH
jgi:ketosteroid isomerase-like protein